ncbi:hypothetical protein A2U01_0079379, partial [Trifolium medium]|nr:hypothetical protein [Trifolium medium]
QRSGQRRTSGTGTAVHHRNMEFYGDSRRSSPAGTSVGGGAPV